MLMPILGVAGALAGAAVALLLMGSDGEGDTPAPLASPASTVASATVAAAPVSAAPTTTPAAQQFTKIEAMRTPDLAKYAEMRELLVAFPEQFPDTPELAKAGSLLFEIDTEHLALADKEFAAARAAAVEHAKAGKFGEVESSIASVEERFAKGPWLDKKGRKALATLRSEVTELRTAYQIKNAAATLKKARAEFEAGNFSPARELLSARAKWPADVKAKADELARDIDRKVAQIAAAKKLAEEREKHLVEFDRLMLAGKYADAMKHAEARAETKGETDETFRAAARVAKALADKRPAMIKGAKTYIGREGRLKLAKRTQTVTVEKVTDSGLSIARKFTINRQTSLRRSNVRWDVLHADQIAEFEKLGGLKVERSDSHIASTYITWAADDCETALQSVEAAGRHPLVERLTKAVRARQTQLAYESAMKRAEESMATEAWKAAVVAYEEALKQRPGDKEATDLLTKARLGAGQRFDENLLVNGSGEDFPFSENGWNTVAGTWNQKSTHPLTKHGKAYFNPWRGSPAELCQDVSVAPFSEAIKSGRQQFEFEGFVAGDHPEDMRIVLEYRGPDGKVLDSFDSGDINANGWERFSKTFAPPALTATVRVRLVATRKVGRSNNCYYDQLSLIARRPDGAPPSGQVQKPGSSPPSTRTPQKLPRTPPTKPQTPIRTGRNILVNGGFEDIFQQTRFASGWIKGEWGDGGGGWSVTSDRTNPRTGDRAIAVRALADDLKPGVVRSLAVEKGSYVVSFWACTDVGKEATVGAQFAGTEVQPKTVGEDWVRVSGTVVVGDKTSRAELKLFTTTKGVRVFFDDVEVKPAQ
jgi:tetratricopeptide (TPR) repeat protein